MTKVFVEQSLPSPGSPNYAHNIMIILTIEIKIIHQTSPIGLLLLMIKIRSYVSTIQDAKIYVVHYTVK